ncbi:MAG: ABC transporter ATP-binding protein [Clostridia bacterium]|nr:ABC transporter ATP-binding protein [Clostridia bacterium]MDH7573009.1 ABC transporter ATP-binding protein [Clostridia bacterium]
MLSVEDLHVAWGDIEVVHGVDFAAREGGITVILGPNGAGKTSIMKAVMGMARITKGVIRFEGVDITRLSTKERMRRGIALCPEGRLVFPALSVRENLELGAYLRADKSGIQEDLDRFFTWFPILKERCNQPAGNLSGGEQQMLAVARMLMSRPKLALLDEPSLGLAPMLVERIGEYIRRINQEGTSVLLVEQNAHMALSISDFAYVIDAGSIVKGGASKELVSDTFVQTVYLGV